jgi:hypothetical protein
MGEQALIGEDEGAGHLQHEARVRVAGRREDLHEARGQVQDGHGVVRHEPPGTVNPVRF